LPEPIFKSKLEELIPAEELLFEPTPGFGPSYEPYLDHAKAHPAKMNTKLLEFLIKAWTKPGETVLDPMAGSGSTGVVAALHGRNAVQVELEKKFYDWMEKAKENIEKTVTLTPKGWIKNICGDARRLSELLGRADVAITSPPYANQEVGKGIRKNRWDKIKGREGFKGRKEWMTGTPSHYSENPENIGNLPFDIAITSPPYAHVTIHADKSPEFWEQMSKKHGRRYISTRKLWKEAKYSESSENIGNLPLGNVDTVITSPPYAETYTGGGDPERRRERLVKAGYDPKDFLGGKARNAVLKHYGEVDVCLTSPPYSESMTKRRKGYTVIPELARTREMPQDTRDDNIANLPHGEISTIITSPPYGEAQEGSGIAKRGYQSSKHSPTDLVGKRSYMPDKFESPENISKLPYVDTVITSPPYETSVSDNKESPLVGADENKYGRWKKGTAKKHSYTQHGEPCKVDIVITSPPYSETINTRSGGMCGLANKGDFKVGISTRTAREYSKSEQNIGNLPHGNVDAVITSPPYADGKKAGEVKPEGVEKYAERWEENIEKRKWNSWGKSFHTPGRLMGIKSLMDGYSNSKENIGNLPLGDIDCCITSPPYEGSLEGTTRHTRGGIASRDPALARTGSYATVMSFGVPVGYSPNISNIGNMKRETYLQAMFRVYGEMWKVLKPGGHAIVVVKPFVRNKEVVDLPWHTWLLMQRVGFQLAKLYKLRLKQESFWRILYYKNHPEVPRLRHEYVLVCRKPTDGEQSEASSAPQVNSIEFLAESLRRERVNKTLSAFLRSLRVGRRG